jgi:hypothetical protein
MDGEGGDADLISAYRRTSFFANTDRGRIRVRIGEHNADLDALLRAVGRRSWAYVTAYNPGSIVLSVEENADRQSALESGVQTAGYRIFAGEGVGDDGQWPPEPSLLILGIDRQAAIELGHRHGQRAVVWGELGTEAGLLLCGTSVTGRRSGKEVDIRTEERTLIVGEARRLANSSRRALSKALRRSKPYSEPDAHGYVDLRDNLIHGIDLAGIEGEFQAAAGHELEGKMRAPWSSAMLAVNSFAPWRTDVFRLQLSALRDLRTLRFEAQCPNGVSQIPPHLDVLLEGMDRVVAVESKCLEYLRPARTAVSPQYRTLKDRGDRRVESKWFSVLEQVPTFVLLDAYQLVKHYLGLCHTYEERPLTLVYLFWEPANVETHRAFDWHRRELARFSQLVGDDPTCEFRALSYTEHWRELSELSRPPGWLKDHLAALASRYLVDV